MRCRPFQEGDEPGILALYQDVFGLNIDLLTWRWHYQQMPEGPAIIVIAENGARIIGHYAVQPRPFWFQGQLGLAGLAIGTMIHPKHRSVSILVEMAHLTYDLCRERGIRFLYAFPRSDILRVRQALLGWTALPPLTEWEAPLSSFVPPPAPETDTAFAQLSGYTVPVEARARETIGGHRSAEWLNWRFGQKPGSEYSIQLAGTPGNIRGYAVVKRHVREGTRYGHILDWQTAANDTNAADVLLAAAWRQFAQWDVERVSCWVSQKLSLWRQISNMPTTLSSRETCFAYLGLLVENTTVELVDHWNIQMADSDVY